MFDIGYRVEDLDFHVAMEEVSSGSTDFDVPEKYTVAPNMSTNYQGIGLGKAGDQWFLTKEDSLESGRTVGGHLVYEALSEHVKFNRPDVGYDEDNGRLILEHLGDISDIRFAGLETSVQSEEFIRYLSIKALAGDDDFGGNIGLKGDKMYVYDFGGAGDPVKSTLKEINRSLQYINSFLDDEIKIEGIGACIGIIAEDIEFSELKEDIRELKHIYPEYSPELQNLQENVRDSSKGQLTLMKEENEELKEVQEAVTRIVNSF